MSNTPIILPMNGSIGVFDSGFGGLTILREFSERMPNYNFTYLGDNARAPYGNRSFKTIYTYTLQAVEKLFSFGCPLVILACNTASAKALRTIQQTDLPKLDPTSRVLGVIRPTIEVMSEISKSGTIGLFATSGTVSSNSYPIELAKLNNNIKVIQQPCPMLVPLVENEEIDNEGCDFFVKKYVNMLLQKDKNIDTILLGCTHFPILANTFKKFIDPKIKLLTQDTIVTNSLISYLKRHPEIDERCTKKSEIKFYTTDSPEIFNQRGRLFFGKEISSNLISLG